MKLFNNNKKINIQNHNFNIAEITNRVVYDFTNKSNIDKENKVNDLTIENLMFTSGNIFGYSGWTEHGIQCNSDTIFNMPYKECKTFEFQINTINWSLRSNAIVFGMIDDLGNEYILKGLDWGYLSCYYYTLENVQVNSTSFGTSGMFNELENKYHLLTFVLNDDKLSCYIDGKFDKTRQLKGITGTKIVGIKLQNTENQTLNLPYRKFIVYEDELTAKQIEKNYNDMITEINTTGYENKPFDSRTTFENVEEMKKANLKKGSIVSTLGYYSAGDNGGATYEISTYDDFYEKLPIDCKTAQMNGHAKTPVDDCGNHRMKNGLVALLKTNGVTTAEQWGCVGDGVTSDTESLICMLALTKTGVINFKDGATYMVATRSDEENSHYTENRFCYSMVNTFSGGCHRPLIANCNNLILDGNPSGDGNRATLKIPDNDFGFGMGMLDIGGNIQGLEIKRLILDSNGLTILNTSVKGVSNKTSNHTICYCPGYNNENSPFEMGVLNDLNIHHCKFLANGTMIDVSDGGGDHILIINPTESKNLWIEDNEFYDWGRWVYSVDLGGSGERFYNYKFNRNICIQTDNNRLLSGAYRGLGWIDFEARKCWTGLEVNGNTVKGLVGFAMNGNGKVLENFSMCNNDFQYMARSYRSAYPYFINFYSVSCAKNSVINNNKFDQPYSVTPSGYVDGLEIRNNTFMNGAVIGIAKMYGDIIFDGNIGTSPSYKLFSLAENFVNVKTKSGFFPPYVDPETNEFTLNLTISNNVGYFQSANTAGFVNPYFPKMFSNMKVTFSNNQMSNISFVALDSPFDFSIDDNIVSRDSAVNNGFVVKGARFTGPTLFNAINNPIMGGGLFKAGDLIVENVRMNRMELCPKMYTDIITDGNPRNLYCTEDGYMPQLYTDIQLKTNVSTQYGRFYFTDTDLYQCKIAGKTDSVDISNIVGQGEITNGTTTLVWVAKIGKVRAELVE